MYAVMFATIASLHGLPDGLLSSLCFTESSHRPHVISHFDGGRHHSYGMCQVQLRTAKEIDKKATVNKLLDAHYNATIASKILLKHYKRYGSWEKSIRAYNCGSYRPQCGNKYYKKVSTLWQAKQLKK